MHVATDARTSRTPALLSESQTALASHAGVMRPTQPPQVKRNLSSPRERYSGCPPSRRPAVAAFYADLLETAGLAETRKRGGTTRPRFRLHRVRTKARHPREPAQLYAREATARKALIVVAPAVNLTCSLAVQPIYTRCPRITLTQRRAV